MHQNGLFSGLVKVFSNTVRRLTKPLLQRPYRKLELELGRRVARAWIFRTEDGSLLGEDLASWGNDVLKLFLL